MAANREHSTICAVCNKRKSKAEFCLTHFAKKKRCVIKIYTFSQVPREVIYTGNGESTRYKYFLTYIFTDSADVQYFITLYNSRKTFHSAEFIY